MNVRCSDCGSQFRVSDEKVGPGGATIRCIRCNSAFHVPGDLGGVPGKPRPQSGPDEESAEAEEGVASGHDASSDEDDGSSKDPDKDHNLSSPELDALLSGDLADDLHSLLEIEQGVSGDLLSSGLPKKAAQEEQAQPETLTKETTEEWLSDPDHQHEEEGLSPPEDRKISEYFEQSVDKAFDEAEEASTEEPDASRIAPSGLPELDAALGEPPDADISSWGESEADRTKAEEDTGWESDGPEPATADEEVEVGGLDLDVMETNARNDETGREEDLLAVDIDDPAADAFDPEELQPMTSSLDEAGHFATGDMEPDPYESADPQADVLDPGALDGGSLQEYEDSLGEGMDDPDYAPAYTKRREDSTQDPPVFGKDEATTEHGGRTALGRVNLKKAEEGGPTSEEQREKPRFRLGSAGAAIAVTANTFFMVAVLAVAFGTFVLLRTEGPIDASLFSGERFGKAFYFGPSDNAVVKLDGVGVYPSRSGKELFFIRGKVTNHSVHEKKLNELGVTAAIRDISGASLEEVKVVLAPLPSSEDLWLIESAEDIEDLRSRLANKSPPTLASRESMTFFAILEAPPSDPRRLEVEAFLDEAAKAVIDEPRSNSAREKEPEARSDE